MRERSDAVPARAHRRRRDAVLEPLRALIRDPFFLLTLALMLAKSIAVVCLINNPDHSVLDLAHFHEFDTSMPIFVSFLVIPVSLGFLLGGRRRLASHLACNAAFSVLIVLDLWYFRAYSTFLSFVLAQETVNLGGLGSGVAAMARPVDLLFVVDLVVLVPLALLWKGLLRGARRSVALAVALPLAATGCLFGMHIWLDVIGTDTDQRFLEPCWEARQTISYQSPLGFHVLDLYEVVLRNRRVELSPAQREEIRSWLEARREALPDNRYRGLLKGRNLIVVQVESLEGCYIRSRVDGQEITPVLNSLLPESLYFTNIYDQANNGLSSDSDLMINTSVYPIHRGATFFRYPDTAYASLPKILCATGYRQTIALHPDLGVYWNWMNALRSIGFQTCLDATAFSGETLGIGLSDAAFLAQAATVIARQPEPFYAFLVTLTSHEPWDLPERNRELRLDDRLAASVVGKSCQSIRYTDRHIGAFLDRLRSVGVLERSVVVVCGDHTALHRFFPDEIAELEPSEAWIRDDRPIVALIVYAPGLRGESFGVTGGQIDIMPTLLYLLGVDEDPYQTTTMGRNLLNTGRDFAVLVDGTVVGRDVRGPVAAHAIRGLPVADLIIAGNYFAPARQASR